MRLPISATLSPSIRAKRRHGSTARLRVPKGAKRFTWACHDTIVSRLIQSPSTSFMEYRPLGLPRAQSAAFTAPRA